MSTLLVDQFSVFYDVLMCLMYLHNVLLNGQGSHWVNHSIELINIFIAAHALTCNTRVPFQDYNHKWCLNCLNSPFWVHSLLIDAKSCIVEGWQPSRSKDLDINISSNVDTQISSYSVITEEVGGKGINRVRYPEGILEVAQRSPSYCQSV